MLVRDRSTVAAGELAMQNGGSSAWPTAAQQGLSHDLLGGIMIGLLISLIVIGLIAGALARLLVPGKQDMTVPRQAGRLLPAFGHHRLCCWSRDRAACLDPRRWPQGHPSLITANTGVFR